MIPVLIGCYLNVSVGIAQIQELKFLSSVDTTYDVEGTPVQSGIKMILDKGDIRWIRHTLGNRSLVTMIDRKHGLEKDHLVGGSQIFVANMPPPQKRHVPQIARTDNSVNKTFGPWNCFSITKLDGNRKTVSWMDIKNPVSLVANFEFKDGKLRYSSVLLELRKPDPTDESLFAFPKSIRETHVNKSSIDNLTYRFYGSMRN